MSRGGKGKRIAKHDKGEQMSQRRDSGWWTERQAGRRIVTEAIRETENETERERRRKVDR